MKRRKLIAVFGVAISTAPLWPYARGIAHAHEDHGNSAKSKRAGLAISAAFAPDGALWIVGLNEQGRLFVQQSAEEGVRWNAPRVLDTAQDAIAAEGENRPKLAFGPNGWAVISYTQPLSKPYTGEIRMLRSTDAGANFSLPFTVHQDRQLITHRFESIAFDSSGALHTFWIDKRDVEAATRDGNKDAYAGAAVYHNVSLDGGRSFGPDSKLADHTCECCRIALSTDAGGGLAAMWRHVFEGDIRDHAFARIAARGTSVDPVVRASFDDWKIDACPHHGPGLAPAASGGFHAVWFGVRNNEPAVRYARLEADGKPRGDVRVIPDEGAEHADVQSVGSSVAVVWRSFNGKQTRYTAWISHDEGKSFTQRELGATDDESDNPVLVRKGEQIFALWRTRKEVRVERLFQ